METMEKEVSPRRVFFIYNVRETLKHTLHCLETKVIVPKVILHAGVCAHTHTLLAQDPAWL